MAAVVQTGGGAGSTSPVTATWTSAPASGNKLVAVVNSNTVVTTPAGWTARVALVNSQGFYVYDKTAGAGESTTLSLTTSGNFPTTVSLIELNAAEVGAFDVVNSDTEKAGVQSSRVIASVTTTGADGSYVLGVIAGHGGDLDAGAVTPTWSNSFAALRTSTAVAPNSGNEVAHYIGSRAMGAAGATGSTTVDWSPANLHNTYGVHVAYKGLGPNGTVAAPAATATIAVRAPSVSNGTGSVVTPAATATATAVAPTVDITTTVTGGGPATATALAAAPTVTATQNPVVIATRATATARVRIPLVTPGTPDQLTYIAADGTPATLRGWWDGSTIQPVITLGYWDGVAVRPFL